MKIKRVISLVSALILALTLIPTTAFALTGGPDYEKSYTSDDPAVYIDETTEGFTTDKSGVLLDVSNGSSGKVSVTGDLETGGIGITVNSADGTESTAAEAKLTVGHVKSVNTGVQAFADGKNTDLICTYTSVESGSIESTGEGAYAAEISGKNAGHAQLIAGDLTAPFGMNVSSEESGSAVLKVEDIFTLAAEDPDGKANSISSNNGYTTAEMESVTSSVNGINASAENNGTVIMLAHGDVNASGAGLNINNKESFMAKVNSVKSTDDAIRIYSEGEESGTMIKIADSAESAEGNALNITDNSGTIFANIEKDVISKADNPEKAGLYYYGSGDGADFVLISETLSGYNGVILSPEAGNDLEQLDLTVWKIAANGGEIIVGDDASSTVAKNVAYLVKIEQPEGDVGTIYATKADGTPLDRKYTSEQLTGLPSFQDIQSKAPEVPTFGAGESGDTSSNEDGYEVTYEGNRILLKADLKPGYTLEAAYNGTDKKEKLSKDKQGNYYLDIKRGGGVYLSAKVVKEDYDITTEAEHGKIKAPATAQYGDEVTIETTSDKGYTLEKLTWTPEGGKPTDITDSKSFTMPAANVTVNAVFTLSRYTIKFVNYDGSELQSGELDYGATPEYKGEDPQKPSTDEYSYIFNGWTPDIAKVTEDATYTATYEEVARLYTITWLNDDGTELDKTVNVPYGTMPKYEAATPTKPDDAKYTYTFKDWTPKLVKVTGDATYTATYTAAVKKATLTFDLAGGTLDGQTGSLTMTAEIDQDITIPNAPVKTGYTFKYWQGSEYYPGDKYTVEGDHTFTAVWEKDPVKTYKVVFDVNGHGTAPATQTVEEGKTANKPADPAAAGWTFGGWYTEEECKNAYDFATPVTSDIKLYAKWTKGGSPTVVPTKTPSNGGKTNPRTGDSSPIGLWIALIAAAAAGLALTFKLKK